MTNSEQALLLRLESISVDNGGVVNIRHMSDTELQIIEKWRDEKFVQWGQICFEHVSQYGPTHWFVLSDWAWTLAAQIRRERAEKLHNDRKLRLA